MSTGALLMMVITQGVFVLVTGYFFYRVLVSKPKEESDSFSENDDVPR